mgnify:FL=1
MTRPIPFGLTGRATHRYATQPRRARDAEEAAWYAVLLRNLNAQIRRIASASAMALGLPGDYFWAAETEIVTGVVSTLAAATTNRGGLYAIGDLQRRYRIGVDWGLVNTEAQQWAQAHAAELAKGLTATTRGQAQQVIADWVASGEPMPKLVGRLVAQAGTERRALLIAQTESTNAFAAGNRIAWKESGVVKREEWNTTQSERVCPICRPLNGKVSRLGQGPRPAIHPGCQCWLTPVV